MMPGMPVPLNREEFHGTQVVIFAVVGCCARAGCESGKRQGSRREEADADGCAYVVGVAEGSNVQLNYGSADWIGVVGILEQRTGLDGEKAINEARAKYKKRARVMGADEAYQYMLGRAQECDREMAVLQS